MDIRAEKIAKARQKLRDHQEKKFNVGQKEECVNKGIQNESSNASLLTNIVSSNKQDNLDLNERESLKETNGDNRVGKKAEINITEILISTKTNLEMQINNLTEKLIHLENLYRTESNNHNSAKQKIVSLECELNNLSKTYATAVQDISLKDVSVSELKTLISNVRDENNNLIEQLEFTKSMLTSKESENTLLNNKILFYQNQLEVFQLQIQQLTNNSSVQPDQSQNTSEGTEMLVNKISNLEQTIEALKKERDQINTHYEHYVRELNEQLRSELIKKENLEKEIQNLYNRENSLIEQISDMEIRIQNYNITKENVSEKQEINTELQKQYQDTQVQLKEINAKYEELQKQYLDSVAIIQELNQAKKSECNHDNFSIDKLNADITSDKIAAQRATEQNKQLKCDVQNLEQVIIKMSKDKLELTEMWTHEKQLNKGLALKLAEVEENIKNMLMQLKAKDEEMIRLQNENREFRRKYENTLEQMNQRKEEENIENKFNHNIIENTCHNHNIVDHTCHNHNIVDNMCHNHNTHDEEKAIVATELTSLIEVENSITKLNINSDKIIPKEDAMTKLQERFLNIMDQVANLSDEKHRLEHIILQLQNETDTICEYIALYQQQRNLLKKREEERSNQLKIYQMECDKLKRHLDELRELLLGFAADHELESFLKQERRHGDLTRVKELLEKLQNCSLINPKFKNLDLNIFYPCSCCSGQIIEI